MKKRILFYSSVNDVNLFKVTGFYVEDINLLRQCGYNVITTNKFISFIRFWNYDVAFLYFYKKAIIPAIVSRIFCKKVIFTGGIDELNEVVVYSTFKRSIYKILFTINYLLSNTCNIVSKEDLINVTNILKSFIPLRLNKLSYHPHSIDVLNFSNIDIVKKENIITTICWMATKGNVERKGVDKTIYIFKKIVEKYPDFKLIIIGAFGEGSNYLKQIVTNENISNKVFFTGSVSEDDKIELLSRSKYYFQLSTYEGFGMAVIEAMILKNLIFHSGNGGLKDTIVDKGYLIDITNLDFQNILNFFSNIHENYNKKHVELELNKSFVINTFSRKNRIEYFKKII